jgi:outer membrane protein OmpA-like peptidoglycan-associated protein
MKLIVVLPAACRMFVEATWVRAIKISHAERVSMSYCAQIQTTLGTIKCRFVFVVITMLFLTNIETFAQQSTSPGSTDVAFSESSPDVAFWVAYWGKPRVVLFGPEEEAFNINVRPVEFPWDNDDSPLNPNILDANVQWLKDHANDRFYIEGYASSEGDLGYNLALSRRRADWVKQVLISKGIPENKIVLAVPWGQLFPACPEVNDECLGKNRLVRLVYSPN